MKKLLAWPYIDPPIPLFKISKAIYTMFAALLHETVKN